MPTPDTGQIVVAVQWLSLDPSQRGWLDDVPSYLPPVQIGEVMRGIGAGTVVASGDPAVPVGTLVTGGLGWQEYALCTSAAENGAAPAENRVSPVRTVPDGMSAPVALNLLGPAGLAAYFGMVEIGRPQPGQTVLVSGAAGAAGATAAQIAKLAGARVVGIAGGERKCQWLTETLGLEAAIDYREGDLEARIRRLAPDGVDVFYDNVGGAVLDAGLAAIAVGGTIVIGGAIAARYPADDRPAPGIRNLPLLMIRSARMQGFTLGSFADRRDEAYAQLTAWSRAGQIVSRQDVLRGSLLDAPAALRRLFTGENFGKQLLSIGDDSPAAG